MNPLNQIDERRDVSGVIDAASQIASRRRDLLIQAKRAQMRGDVREVFRIIDELVPDSVIKAHDEKMPGTVTRIDRRTSGR